MQVTIWRWMMVAGLVLGPALAVQAYELANGGCGCGESCPLNGDCGAGCPCGH